MPDFPHAEATIDGLQGLMASGALTAAALAEAYLARIAQVDRSGPALRAVVELNPDALAIAEGLDAERRSGSVRGPLHGIPVLIKDNIATADRMETAAGSLALVGRRPPQDATVAARLCAAGAVILGKTNMSEWANFRSSKPVSGWSGRGGQTRNPWALARNPSGSSSGSAAAVSANLCAVAVGTETDGSILSPSSVCGIVGVKPTVGRVSRAGIIPISASQDTAGPHARTVRDAALLLAALSGPDPRDAATLDRPAKPEAGLAAAIPPGALRGARIGVWRGPFGFGPKVEPVLAEAVAALRSAGAVVVDPVEIDAGPIAAPEMTVLLYEFKAGIDAWLASLGPGCPLKSLEDLIRYNEDEAAREMPFFGQELFHLAQAKGPLSDREYLHARSECLRLARDEGLDAALRAHRLDAIAMVTNGPAWLIDEVNGDAFTGGSARLAAVSGRPSVTVPAGRIAGLPVGFSFAGPAWGEARLLALAADFEDRTRARRDPGLS
jgi:amidase